MYDIDEYLFLMYLKWNDQESVDDIKEAFRVFDKVCSDYTIATMPYSYHSSTHTVYTIPIGLEQNNSSNIQFTTQPQRLLAVLLLLLYYGFTT